MSDRKLLEATAAGVKPMFPPKLDLFQRLYETRRQGRHPLNEERLREFAEDLKIISLHEDISFDPHFVTDDGTRWLAVGFRYISGKYYKIAFPAEQDPKHHDGTVSAQHVAMYCDDNPAEEELNHVAQAAYAIFKTYVF